MNSYFARLRQNNDYFEYTANSPIIPNSMSVDRSNSETPLYSSVRNGTAVVTSIPDYQQPIDCLPGKLVSQKGQSPTNDGHITVIQENPGYSEIHFT